MSTQSSGCIPPLTIHKRDHVAWFTLNRPEVGNAVNQELLQAIDHALTDIQDPRNAVRCIVLTGAGQHFCTGIDLRCAQIPPAGQRDSQAPMARSYLDHCIERMLSLRIPIVAAINGAAAGAGMTL